MAGPRQAQSANRHESLKAHVLIVEARYYETIGDQLLAGARRALEEAGATHHVITVSGALEIPVALAIAADAAAADKQPYDGAVALGCVIRGDTIHFETVSEQSARGIMDVSIARKLPVGNAILTVENEDQAIVRASLAKGDKGGEAARAALALIRIKRDLTSPRVRG